jgi:hypothetical protein
MVVDGGMLVAWLWTAAARARRLRHSGARETCKCGHCFAFAARMSCQEARPKPYHWLIVRTTVSGGRLVNVGSLFSLSTASSY